MDDEIIEPKKRQQHVWVRDKAGNEYICPVDALKDPKNASEEEFHFYMAQQGELLVLLFLLYTFQDVF